MVVNAGSKTAKRTSTPGSFRKGHDPRRGTGKPGRGGPKPEWFREEARRQLARVGGVKIMADLLAGKLTYDIKVLAPNGKLTHTERHPPKHADRVAAYRVLSHVGECEPPPPAPVTINRPVLVVGDISELGADA